MSTPLADRLRAAFGSSLRGTVEPPPAPARSQQATTLPGREIETEAGPCLVYEERYPLEHRHGGLSLGECLGLPPLALACLAKRRRLDGVDLREAVFIDTETTGLAGGTGTTAFLVGIGFFAVQAPVGAQFIAPIAQGGPTTQGSSAGPQDGAMNCAPTGDGHARTAAFVVRQFFMRDFGEERALLVALAEALAPFRYAVSFNGKSFDLPLLETRYVLARMAKRRWQPELHFDLLHPARRLWRERLGTCSLAALEEAVLGHRRVADVPSWAIPSLYAAYLREGASGPLARVFSHNRHDLLSLAALVTHVGRRLAEPLGQTLGADELLAVARLYEELGLRSEAVACLEQALVLVDGSGEASLRERVRLALALCCKRDGRRERAFALWRELARGSAAITGLIELAKHHEHRERDALAALDCVEQALAIVELREARDGIGRWRNERAELERRLARLLRKRRLV